MIKKMHRAAKGDMKKLILSQELGMHPMQYSAQCTYIYVPASYGFYPLFFLFR